MVSLWGFFGLPDPDGAVKTTQNNNKPVENEPSEQQDNVQSDPYAAYNPQPQADPYAAYNPQGQISSQPDPYSTYDTTTQSVNQTPVDVQPAPVTNQGPPLPATGLPEGWTMEQWGYYGAQYIAAQTPNITQNQPTITDTTTQSESNPLNDILDDLDL